jgi:ABC-type nitrate/sulfonate/bicarbonate transport system permease component
LWEAASRTGLMPATSLPPASEVLAAWPALAAAPAFWTAVGHTLASAIGGLGIVVLIAVPLALAIGLSRFARESTWLVIEFLKPIPPVAMIPLGLLLWGPSETMKLTLICFGALWPFLTQMVYGIGQVDHVALDMARSYRLKAWLTTSRIVVPSLLPFAATGLRVSASIAIVVSVVTELIGGAAGLGRDIMIAQSSGNLPAMYALILTTGLLGLLINFAFAAAERPLLFWHPSQRKDAER